MRIRFLKSYLGFLANPNDEIDTEQVIAENLIRRGIAELVLEKIVTAKKRGRPKKN
ncbi:MAG: hypothetical protein WC364_15505 [Eubacteriales bacterium]|jgi:hypothetical protein